MQRVHPVWLLFISLIVCINAEVTPTNIEGAPEELGTKKCENPLVKNAPTDYQKGIAELLNFINSLDNILLALKTYLAAQETEFATLNAKIDAQVNALNLENGRLTTKTNRLIKMAQMNPVTWRDIDDLITTQATEIQTGSSFNGLTLSDIKSRASQFGMDGKYTTVVVVNHLDEAITNFTIYDEKNTAYDPAPNSVPGRTEEVFTFTHPSYGHPDTSFSYVIPALSIRIAAISLVGAWGVGLAFIPDEADMQIYYISHKGIEGSSAWESGEHNKDRYLCVGYKNFYARMFAKSEGQYKATLRIELVKFPLDD